MRTPSSLSVLSVFCHHRLVVIAGALLWHRLLVAERLRIAAYVRGRDLAIDVTDVGERGHGSLAELEGGVRIVDGRRDRAPEQNHSVEAAYA